MEALLRAMRGSRPRLHVDGDGEVTEGTTVWMGAVLASELLKLQHKWILREPVRQENLTPHPDGAGREWTVG